MTFTTAVITKKEYGFRGEGSEFSSEHDTRNIR